VEVAPSLFHQRSFTEGKSTLSFDYTSSSHHSSFHPITIRLAAFAIPHILSEHGSGILFRSIIPSSTSRSLALPTVDGATGIFQEP
jgi:hypothetical protein